MYIGLCTIATDGQTGVFTAVHVCVYVCPVANSVWTDCVCLRVCIQAGGASVMTRVAMNIECWLFFFFFFFSFVCLFFLLIVFFFIFIYFGFVVVVVCFFVCLFVCLFVCFDKVKLKFVSPILH